MIDGSALRQIMGCFTTGVAVATSLDPRLGAVGLTINSLTSVSLEPPLILFCVDKRAHLFETFQTSTSFGINILGDGQEPVSRYFADRHRAKKPERLWDKPRGNVPLLRGTLGWMTCKKIAAYDGGDHTILLGQVEGLYKRSGQRDPLLYFHGRYRKIRQIK